MCVLDSELQEILRELLRASGAQTVEIDSEDQLASPGYLRVPLGHGGFLQAFFVDLSESRKTSARQQALEQGARRLRACFLHHQGETWPHLRIPGDVPDRRRLILARMQQFLRGLVDTSALRQMVLMCRGQIIASALPMDVEDIDRLDFLSRQLDRISQQAPGTDHGELVQADVYGRSFWYRAALFGFAENGYSEDFVRHRSKQVARELAYLLAMLDEGPNEPIKEAPDPAY